MNRKKEQGIALLYVLGILALLIAMAMAFMNSSIFDQRSAAQSASSVMAEQLAISTMQRLIWGIQQSATSGLSEDSASFSYMPGDHYGFNGNSSGDIARDGLDIGSPVNDTTVMNDLLYVDDLKNHFDYKNASYRNSVRWILNRVKTGNNDYQIIGRTAFILVPLGGGKVNPNYLVSPTIDEVPSGTTYPENRIGKNMNEINIKAITGVFLPNNIINFFNYPAQGGARPGPTPDGWVDNFFPDLQSKLYPTSKIPTQIRDVIDEVFDFNTQNSPEYYQMDIDNDKVFSDRERIHRFYLPRFSNTGEYWDPALTTNYWDDADFNINRDILLDADNNGTPDIDLAPEDTALASPRTDYRFDNTREDLTVSPKMRAIWGLGIPWLALYGYSDSGSELNTAEIKGTFPTTRARRQQIAANLKDYCDRDSIPTSDITPGSLANVEASNNWGHETNIPAYTGNEKTPYINEIQIYTDYTLATRTTKSSDPTPIYTREAEATLKIGLEAELVNIYRGLTFSDLEGKKPRISLYCRLISPEFGVTWGSDAPGTFALANNGKLVYPVNDSDSTRKWRAGDPGYFILSANDGTVNLPIFITEETASDSCTSSDLAGNPLPEQGKLTISFELVIENIILEYDNGNVDYVKVGEGHKLTYKLPDTVSTFTNAGEVGGDWTAVYPSSGHSSSGHVFSIQTEDPRQNLNPDDWKIEINEFIDPADRATKSNLGKKNTSATPPDATTPGNDFDIETATDPAYINDNIGQHLSTAYIRNAPMISPWELGLIHRGAKWQTINLKKYNHHGGKPSYTISVGGFYYLLGGGIYSEGDANILDQIKMTPDAESPLKVNLKGAGKMVMNGLLDVQKMGILSGEDFVGRASRDSTETTVPYLDLCDELMGGAGSPSALSTVNNEVRKDFDPSSGTGEYDTRAALANVTGIDNGGTTDAAKEEWIGKVINLTEARKGLDLFEIVIVSQAIRDVGGASAAVPIQKYYRDSSFELQGPVSVSSRLGEVNFTTASGVTVLSDEILAQRKLRVRGYRKPDGNVQILSIKTVE